MTDMGMIATKRALMRTQERVQKVDLVGDREIPINWWVPMRGRPDTPNIRILPSGDVRFSVGLLAQFGYHPHDKPRLRIGSYGRAALIFQFPEATGVVPKPSAFPFQINRDGKVGSRLRAMLGNMDLPAGYYRPQISITNRRVVISALDHDESKIVKEITND